MSEVQGGVWCHKVRLYVCRCTYVHGVDVGNLGSRDGLKSGWGVICCVGWCRSAIIDRQPRGRGCFTVDLISECTVGVVNPPSLLALSLLY